MLGLKDKLILIPNPIYIEKKKTKQDLEQELPSLLQSYDLRGKQLFVSDFSRLLRHAKEKGRCPILYSKKTLGPHVEENVNKFSKEVENTVGKGEIAHYEQFLLFPHCFQETCATDT